ncbi:sodium-dependent transporter [Paractinoplanes rishiriensis]|uniref:Sodium-dependent transporter n=1 Tax=Paractinoplanes rishiriensis TaxID=1050105 RepID=A0A919MZH6_9ACTN|nr:sodium-dependent transporter [Actinoplanes rishiriensis]GIF01260.1 sodium-dependent transporter [Actinoplanes rishiriensis]
MATSGHDLVEPREQWGTRLGFILAAMGSAIGLGNIWRYPYVVYDNGGGAFLIPYFIAIATAAVPLLILEYALGHRYRHAAPFAFRSVRRGAEWLGWFQIGISMVIMTYYVVIIGWVLSYFYYSFGTRWGDDPDAFFFGSYLGTSDSFWAIGGIQWKVLLSVVIAWAITYLILRRGVRRGIELAAKILMPLLIVMIAVIVVRGVTLPGAAAGLNVLLTPDFGALTDAQVWVAAYGQVFFSFSIGFAVMIVYASYLRHRSELSNSAVIVGMANSGFEFLAALGVFSVLGFLASQQGTGVTEVVTSGVGLAFVAFPQIINEMPGFNSLFGVLFFGALLFAGITSAVSIMECAVAGVREKFRLSRTAAVNWMCGITALASVLYVTRGGLYYLDVVDHFINSFALIFAGLAEVILIAWIARQLGPLQAHVNRDSYLRVGWWWTISLTAITPLLLSAMAVINVYQEATTRYEDYPLSGLLVMGWGVVLVTLVLAVVLQRLRRHEPLPATIGD